jgi:hypothetical protein
MLQWPLRPWKRPLRSCQRVRLLRVELLSAGIDSRMVGIGVAGGPSESIFDGRGEIRFLYVDPDFRRRSIGWQFACTTRDPFEGSARSGGRFKRRQGKRSRNCLVRGTKRPASRPVHRSRAGLAITKHPICVARRCESDLLGKVVRVVTRSSAKTAASGYAYISFSTGLSDSVFSIRWLQPYTCNDRTPESSTGIFAL